MSPSLPLGVEKQVFLEKALTAHFLPSYRHSTSYTVAKLPFPSLRIGLNLSWKPFWCN